MSLIDLNLISIILSDLNSEIRYKIAENTVGPFVEDILSLESDGEHHCIMMLGKAIWSTKVEQSIENIPLEIEMALNERSKFEGHLRLLANDRLNLFKNLEV